MNVTEDVEQAASDLVIITSQTEELTNDNVTTSLDVIEQVVNVSQVVDTEVKLLKK